MQAVKLLKSLLSLPRFLRGASRQAKSPAGHDAQRAPRSFRPSFETLENRLLPSTTNLMLNAVNPNLNPISIINFTPPAAPSFVVSDTSSTAISLSWQSVSRANGYLVDEWINGAWHQLANFGSTTTGCTVSGLSKNTTYYFEIGAYNAYGTSFANWQSITTIDHPTAGGTYTNVTSALFGPNGPSYLDVHQGALGDCWLDASLAEVAARQPGVIQSMFTYKGTELENGVTVGLYSVRLYSNSGAAFYVTVDTELPSGGGLYDHPANGTMWVSLAEKAYVEANGMGLVTSGTVGSDSYAALNGGWPVWALHAITGQSASSYSVNPSNIAAAWNAGELICMCTTNPPNTNIVPEHCYAVVGYNPSSGLPFEVYNPWGTNSSGIALGTYNGHSVWGLFIANGAFLSQNFTSQAIAATPPSGIGTNGAEFFQTTLDHTSTPGGGYVQTGFVVAGQTPGANGSLLLTALTQGADQAASDSLWAETSNSDLNADVFGDAYLHLAPMGA